MNKDNVEKEVALAIVRVDRLTNAQFPVQSGVENVGAAKYFVDEETRKRGPQGDYFLVLQGDTVVYDPTMH